MIKAMVWKDVKKELNSFKRLIIYILIIALGIYNYNLNKNISYQMMNIQISIFFILMLRSKEYYSNIDTLLSLPISINKYCIFNSIIIYIKTLLISFLYILALLSIHYTNIKDITSIIVIKEFLYFNINLLVVFLLCESLITICGKKFMYIFILIGSTLLMLLESLVHNSITLFVIISVVAFLVMFLVYIILKRVSIEYIMERWI